RLRGHAGPVWGRRDARCGGPARPGPGLRRRTRNHKNGKLPLMAEILDAYGNPVRSGGAAGAAGGPVMQEIASAARDDVAGGWLGELRSFSDEILSGQLGGNLRAYRKILDDWQVQSTLQQRRR